MRAAAMRSRVLAPSEVTTSPHHATTAALTSALTFHPARMARPTMRMSAAGYRCRPSPSRSNVLGVMVALSITPEMG